MLRNVAVARRGVAVVVGRPTSTAWRHPARFLASDSANAANGGKEDAATANANTNEDLSKKVAELTDKLSKATTEAGELKQRVLYALAEAENARRIAARDVDNARNFAVQSFAKSLLDVADNLERAIKTFPAARANEPDLKAVLDGISGTEKEMLKAFKSVGLEPFGAVGDVCDPHKFEALFQVPDPSKTPNTVAEVLRRGFTLKGRVLRPAQVGAVSKGS